MAVAVALAILAVPLAWVGAEVIEGNFVAGIGFSVPAALLLALRRRHPLLVLVAVTLVVNAAVLVPEATGVEVLSISALVALYSAGAYGRAPARDRVRWVAVLVTAGVGLQQLLFAVPDDAPDGVALQVLRLVLIGLNLAYFTAAWRLGDAVRERAEREAELEASNRALAAERDENARRAVTDERIRIARELHDVVAHHVSVMGVQAGAARRVLAKQPEAASEALSQIEASSREAVAELYRLLGFLRGHGDADGTHDVDGSGRTVATVAAPTPTLAELPELVAGVARRMPVQVVRQGEERHLPPSVELSAYRVVQEALTNCLRHAGDGARVEVRLEFRPDVLVVEVLDDGRGAAASLPSSSERHHEAVRAAAGGGHGIVGMRERVALHGGEFRAGPRAGGGFGVRATFPLALRVAS